MISRSQADQISPARDLRRIDVEKKKKGQQGGEGETQQAAESRVHLRKNDFERGVTDHSDKALEVLLSSTSRKPVVIFSARALARSYIYTTPG